ncbi:MAG: hypothetical protein HY922_17580 [Elusimicrobia bacterium]|nr:hypothetical protein [Elusimicrobiota bacterium]
MRIGPIGMAVAGLTLLAAVAVMLLLLFGKTLLLSALVSWLWPRIFSPDFTKVVFGVEQVSFWKVLLLFVLAGAVVSLLRRRRRDR